MVISGILSVATGVLADSSKYGLPTQDLAFELPFLLRTA
jgi:hypothetical protein